MKVWMINGTAKAKKNGKTFGIRMEGIPDEIFDQIWKQTMNHLHEIADDVNVMTVCKNVFYEFIETQDYTKVI